MPRTIITITQTSHGSAINALKSILAQNHSDMGRGPQKRTLAKRNRKPLKRVEYRNCSVCQKPFIPTSKNHLFCSKECWSTTMAEYTSGHGGISTTTIGAIAELIAGAHLMGLGYETYRALSAASSSDLVAIKDGLAFRFEVRSAGRNKMGELTYAKARLRSENFALVVHRSNEVILLPEIPVPFCIPRATP